ncbi:hypothetical protein SLA2020_126710 [Shorea laevis]
MGNCASVHSSADPGMTLGVQIESPSKEMMVEIEKPVAELGLENQRGEDSFRELGNADFFFDSQPCLDSDCEDFFSVNGDPISSQDNTPPHPERSIKNSVHDKAPGMDDEPSPNDMKKQLLELFCESFNSTAPVNVDQNLAQPEDKPASLAQPERSAMKRSAAPIPNSTPGGEITPYRGSISKKEKSNQSAQCCLPGLVRSLSFGERKKRLNPPKTDGCKPNVHAV